MVWLLAKWILGWGTGFETWPGHCVVFLGKCLNFAMPLPTQEYKWVPVNCQPWWNARQKGGRSIAKDWNPIQGGVVLLLIPSCYGNQVPSLDGPGRGGYCKGLASYPGESSITPSLLHPMGTRLSPHWTGHLALGFRHIGSNFSAENLEAKFGAQFRNISLMCMSLEGFLIILIQTSCKCFIHKRGFIWWSVWWRWIHLLGMEIALNTRG